MTAPSAAERERQKRAAAARAVEEVADGMVLGLGSGSTAEFALEILARRVAQGLRIAAIPTSERTGALARRLGVPLTSFAEHRRIDLTIDGADEVEHGTLNLIKGLGGALLREKIVRSKLVDRLGTHVPLPVEIVSFGWQTVLERLSGVGAVPTLRRVGDKPFATDSGNYIADCAFPAFADPAALEIQLAGLIGVVESGLFIGLATTIMVGGESGIDILER